jgi:hypothetical protein
MGQARLRAKEIAEIKRWGGRLVDTPEKTTPVMFRAGDEMWISSDSEFGTWVTAAHAITVPTDAQREFARLALIAERSGVKERECQLWFELQLRHYADARLSTPMQPPIIFAQSLNMNNNQK